MDRADWVTIAGGTAAGALPGWLMGGKIGGIAGGIVGLVLAVIATRMKVRPVVSLSVIAGTVTGAMIGNNITHALCMPALCPGIQVFAAVVTGAGAFVGVGLIVALATRSFDEYHEAAAANRPPPRTACGPGENCD
jgi:NAD/NADP transhydrogenase beta subunit